jgi:hypothetical protein
MTASNAPLNVTSRPAQITPEERSARLHQVYDFLIRLVWEREQQERARQKQAVSAQEVSRERE